MTNPFKDSKFNYLFAPLMLGAMNDSLIRNVIVIWYTYFLNLSWPTREDLVTLCTFAFILPSLIFASYAGKYADSYDKVKILRKIKLFEIVIVITGLILCAKQHPLSQLLILFALGAHSTFAGPIKYSILPQYYQSTAKIIVATGYMEFGTLFAILLGQLIGGALMANDMIMIAGIIVLTSAIIGYICTYYMQSTTPLINKPEFHKNIFIDNWNTYKRVVTNKNSKINIHAISWFWCLSMVYTTQFSLFALKYLGANNKVFSLLSVLYTIGLGVGAVYSAKYFSKKALNRKLVPICTLLISILTLIVLLNNNTPVNKLVGLNDFITKKHLIDIIALISISVCSGIFSIICYSDLQINATPAVRSQTIAVNNWFNAFYMVVLSLILIVILPEFDIWNTMLLLISVNVIFCIWYAIYMPKNIN